MLDLLCVHAVVLDGLADDVAKAAVVHARVARNGENRRVVVDELLVAQPRERRKNLPPREIAGATEDDERARPVYGPLGSCPSCACTPFILLGRPAFVAMGILDRCAQLA